jgi:hypothetical protein
MPVDDQWLDEGHYRKVKVIVGEHGFPANPNDIMTINLDLTPLFTNQKLDARYIVECRLLTSVLQVLRKRMDRAPPVPKREAAAKLPDSLHQCGLVEQTAEFTYANTTPREAFLGFWPDAGEHGEAPPPLLLLVLSCYSYCGVDAVDSIVFREGSRIIFATKAEAAVSQSTAARVSAFHEFR